MTRLPKKVGKYTHPVYKTEVDIRLDASDGMFQAEVGGSTLMSKDLEKLKENVRKAIEENARLEYIPIICVKYARPKTVDDNKYSFTDSFSIERFYATERPDKTWARVNWNVPEQNRANKLSNWYKNPVTFPYYSGYSSWFGQEVCLIYSESLWAALLKLVEGKQQLNNLIANFIEHGTDNAECVEMVTKYGINGLPAPQETENV
jgi:hypothetical protein